MRSSARDFFSAQEQAEISRAVMDAELDTSGEVRVHIETSCIGSVLDRAAFLFKQLGMTKTHLRNGVLIYLSVRDRKFAIIGDHGIHHVVPEDFWDHIKEDAIQLFKEGQFKDGLIRAITETGKHLKKHFPYRNNDVNELPDEISFGKE
ncbi:MAG: TPM domain-containing protein [bacterium]